MMAARRGNLQHPLGHHLPLNIAQIGVTTAAVAGFLRHVGHRFRGLGQQLFALQMTQQA